MAEPSPQHLGKTWTRSGTRWQAGSWGAPGLRGQCGQDGGSAVVFSGSSLSFIPKRQWSEVPGVREGTGGDSSKVTASVGNRISGRRRIFLHHPA